MIMKNENIYLAAWEIAGNRVKLVFSDRDVVYISISVTKNPVSYTHLTLPTKA